MRYLTVSETLEIYTRVMRQSGGMELFLLLNGCEISATVDEQVDVILRVAAGEMEREAFTEWLDGCIVP